jgi:hypothetical protein
VATCEQCGRETDGDERDAKEPASVPTPLPNGSEDELGPAGRRCPACGSALASAGAPEEEEEEIHPKAPWHFKVLVVGSVIYLGYRLYQGIGWLIHHG